MKFNISSPENLKRIFEDLALRMKKDAMVLPQTMITLQNPSILTNISKNVQSLKYNELFEALNLIIIDTKAGMPIYAFGDGMQELYNDLTMLSGFLHALTSIFTETHLSFNSYLIEAINLNHNKAVYIFREGDYLSAILWDKVISKEFNQSFESIKKIVQSFLKALPPISKL